MAKITPVAGALKMAATPTAAPATMSTLALFPVRKRRSHVVATEPMVPPSRIEVPSRPIAPPVPRVARAPINLKGSGRAGSTSVLSWYACRYASLVDESVWPRRTAIWVIASPAVGMVTATQSGASRNQSSPTSTACSKPTTAKPVRVPTAAASTGAVSRDRQRDPPETGAAADSMGHMAGEAVGDRHLCVA